MKPTQPSSTLPLVRCAIYTRKSTEEGLQQAFNTLDAQRESAEAYVKSQAHDGWTCLPDRYDDGGFTGGNMDRPALQRLMADIDASKVDAVIVYKVDRLSRSLLDFARMMQVFDDKKISFVSDTQQFNTATSMGRLVLNVLLSFAQFEREIISERTRDKIAMTRRRGKWSGGLPLLGYDVDRGRSRLVVNEDEAAKVRAIFDLYRDHEALPPVVRELANRGWVGKRWTTKGGRERGGQPITKVLLHRMLTNVTYVGRVKYKAETHPGEHEAVVSAEVWDAVQRLLRRNWRTGGAPVRNEFGMLLKGILRCACCDSAMTPAHTTKQRTKRYRYYTCSSAQKRGWATCPSKSIPASQIEEVVVSQIRAVGRNPAVLTATLAEARRHDDARLADLDAERRGLERELARWHVDVRKLALTGQVADDDPVVGRLADLNERIGLAEGRLARVKEQVTTIRRQSVNEGEAAEALRAFGPLWDELTPTERNRMVGLLVQRVDYDGATGRVTIAFHPTGIRTLAEQNTHRDERIA
jgi:site-specific DNA recombinase